MLGFALKDGSSHFLNMKHLLTSSLNNKIVSYCHFTKRLVVLPIRSNVNQFIFLVSATVKYRACFVLLILMFVFCSKLKKKKKWAALHRRPQRVSGWNVATLAQAPSLQVLCLVVSSTSLMPLPFSSSTSLETVG